MFYNAFQTGPQQEELQYLQKFPAVTVVSTTKSKSVVFYYLISRCFDFEVDITVSETNCYSWKF